MSFKPPILGQPQLHQVLPQHVQNAIASAAYPITLGQNAGIGLSKFEKLATELFVAYASTSADLETTHQIAQMALEHAKIFWETRLEFGKPTNTEST